MSTQLQILNNSIGNYYYHSSIDSALKYHKISLELSQTENSANYSTHLSNVAHDLIAMGNWPEALQYSLAVSAHYEKYSLNKSMRYAKALADISSCYEELGNYKLALSYKNKSNDAKNIIKVQAMVRSFKTSVLLKQIVIAKKLSTTHRIIIALGIISIIFLAIIIIVLRKQNKRKKETLEEIRNIQASKDQIFVMIAHDIISPMQAYNNLGLLLAGFIRENKQNEILRVSEQLEYYTVIFNHNIQNFFNLAKDNNTVIENKKNTENLSSLMEEGLELHQLTIQNKKIQIEKIYNPEEIWQLNKFYFSNIFRNALDNALKYAPEESTVSIRINRFQTQLILTISNQGSLSAEVNQLLEEIFRNNNQSNLLLNEVGYGISIIKNYADKMNAKANYTQGEDHIVFTLRLPLA